jgi:hypothetical protein
LALNPDWSEFVELLLANEVEFLIVGALALAHHGLPRMTGDIDFFVGNAPENAEKVLRVVKEFGFESLGLTQADFESPDQVVQLGIRPRRIDILTKIDGVSFEDAWKRRVSGKLDDYQVFFPCLDDFLTNKRAAGRPKDLVDADAVDPALD